MSGGTATSLQVPDICHSRPAIITNAGSLL
jgi:hypothetical protein